MTERTQEQLDLIYEPLQQQLRDDYSSYVYYYLQSFDVVEMDYKEWLMNELYKINEEIANFKEQE